MSKNLIALVATAVGTAIDAGAVGVGLALLGENIWLIAACIGATTFALATLGLLIGKAAGTRLGKIVELVGGIALIALIGWLFFKQALDAPTLLGLALIVAGVLVLNLFSKSSGH